jgi:hypothetical protein
MILWVVERQTVLEQTGGIEEYREEILDKIEMREKEEAERFAVRQAKKALEREKQLKLLEERKKNRGVNKQ